MGIALSAEHRALSETVTGWVEAYGPLRHTRELVEAGDREADLNGLWKRLADQGYLGLHVSEAAGGSGYGWLEAAVVAEQLAAALFPGPVLSTLVASAAIADHDPALASRLVSGAGTGCLVDGPGIVVSSRQLVGSAVLGRGRPDADVVVLRADDAGEDRWFAVSARDVTLAATDALDPSAPLVRVSVDHVDLDAVLARLDPGPLETFTSLLAAAEACGVARWCLDTAVEHARTREQFGSVIGRFQAIKHRCVDMLVRYEMASATCWDALQAEPSERQLWVRMAAEAALPAAVTSAKDTIQILGGMGFTWEHDAHRYLRRATALEALAECGHERRRRIGELVGAGIRQERSLDLGDQDIDGVAQRARACIQEIEGLDPVEARRIMADRGYLTPHWPEPWGLDANARAQLVIDREFARASVERPDLVIGGWALATIIRHGTDDQKQRLVRATLYGDITWCQLFSEPEAGSDLAALRTRAERVEGGWRLTGHKIWTTGAHMSDWGICLARTDPSAPKHEGITCFLVDMSSPGLDVRPLREMTGRSLFNEVFLDGVLVRDENVVGAVNDGWRVGRTTLGNERVAMATGSTLGRGVEGVLQTLNDHVGSEGAVTDEDLADVVVEGVGLSALGFRTTVSQVSGLEPGAAASVRKLVAMEHAQHCADTTLELYGRLGATTEPVVADAGYHYLLARCLTIAGGTTEVQKNLIGERLLGLPRDAM